MSFKNKGWWCSTFLSILVAAFVCLIYIYVANTANQAKSTSYRIISEKLTEERCTPVCNTKECVIFAEHLNQILKPTADPCENFQTFICGRYEERFSEDEGMSIIYDSEITMYKMLNNIINDIQADPESAKGKLKILYDSCMNYASSEKNSLHIAKKFLDDIGIPDWPNLSPDFQFPNTDIPTILGNLKARGEVSFLMFLPYFRARDTVKVRLDGRYFSKLLKPASKESIVHILKYFQLDSETIEYIWNDYDAIKDSILKLEKENCRDLPLDCLDYPDDDISWFEDFLWPEKNCTTVRVNCSDHDGNWTSVCKASEVFLSVLKLDDRMDKDKLMIEEGDDHFVRHIFPVLDAYSPRAVANYLALDFYLDHLEELNFYFQQTKHRYFPKQRCDLWKPTTSRFLSIQWKVCTKWISENMLFPLQLEFLAKYLTQEEIKKISDLFKECKSDVIEFVPHQKWISEEDKAALIKNLEEIGINLDRLKGISDYMPAIERYMNDYYKEFHPTAENFFKNVLDFRRAISDVQRVVYSERTFQRFKFIIQASAAIPSYDIQFGMLIPPFYVPGFPRLLNLLLFGRTTGHEIGHMIDYYLEDTISYQEIKDKKSCLINQYSEMKFDFLDGKLNGSQYINDDFPDAIAVELMDRIIEKYVSKEEDFLLPGFPYSSKKMMYIVHSMYWCSKSSKVEELFFKEMEVHSPNKFRIIVPLQNSRGFSETFNCSEGSYMNPAAKCNIMI